MLWNRRPVVFESYAAMAGHLDRWAASTLTSPEAWQTAVVGSHDWLDFAPRNQLLLLSYGIDGPAAGAETWRLVPSSEPGRECAVRAGEHGYPVRVPIATTGREPDPFVGGTRPTRSQVERWEWRPVFGIDQLARRPGPGMLTPFAVPEAFTGGSGGGEFVAAVTRVVTATVRGRGPRSDDAHRMLVDAAGRLPRSAERPELLGVLREQVAWLVAERVGHAAVAVPREFDPTGLRPRERWERLLDVLDPARKLTAALGATVGFDLVRSSIPRMQVVDDRVVPADRRHRLPAATFEALPVGRWVTVGPYTSAEWAARGELGGGKGAFLRLNNSAYIVAVENGDTVSWRLEDVDSRTGHGRLANGTSRDLEVVRRDVARALEGRYRALPLDQPPPTVEGRPMSPAAFDRTVARLADSDDYSRTALAQLIGPRLDRADAERVALADHRQLTELVGAAGVTAASVVAVLHADGCSPNVAVELLPTLGVPMSSAIRVLHERWDVPRTDAATMLYATGAEMREAGCTPTEILQLRPESILATLRPEPHLWELAAGTMAVAGHTDIVIVGHLATHAPTAECYASGIAAAIVDPTAAIGHSLELRVNPTHVVATAERLGFTPAELGAVLRAEHAPTTLAVAVLGQMCAFDDAVVDAAWRGVEIPDRSIIRELPADRITSIGGAPIGTADELLASMNSHRKVDIAPSLFDQFPSPPPDLTMEHTKT